MNETHKTNIELSNKEVLKITKLIKKFNSLVHDNLISIEKSNATIPPSFSGGHSGIYSIIKYENKCVGVSLARNQNNPFTDVNLAISDSLLLVENLITINTLKPSVWKRAKRVKNQEPIKTLEKQDSRFMYMGLMLLLKIIIENPQIENIRILGDDEKRSKAFQYLKRYGFQNGSSKKYPLELFCKINSSQKEKIFKTSK